MKPISLSRRFQQKLKLIKKRDSQTFAKISQQLSRFRTDPHHPSLRIHKLRGELKNVWSLAVTTNFRLVFVEDDEYYFFDLGTHDQVYKDT